MGDEDKQFEATPQKLERARKEGQVVKSKEVCIALSLLIMFSVIKGISGQLQNLICRFFLNV